MYIKYIYCTILYVILLNLGKRVDCHRSSGTNRQSNNDDDDQDTITLIELNVKDRRSTTKIEYIAGDNSYEKFTANKGYLIHKVTRDGLVMFESKNEDYLDRVVIYRDANNERHASFLQPGESEPVSQPEARSTRPGQPKQSRDTSDQGRSSSQVQQVKFVTLNVRVLKSSEGIDYMFYEDEQIHKFLCQRGYLIDKVRTNSKVIWEASRNDYLNRVLIKPDSEGQPSLSLLTPKDSDPDEPTYRPQTQEHDVTKQVSAPQQRDRPKQSTIPSPKHITPKSKQDQIELVEVDIKNKESTKHIRYKKDDKNDREFFTAKKGFLISKIVRKGKVIHESTNNEYFDRLVLYRDNNNERHVKFLQPGEVDLDFIVVFDLDVKVKQNTEHYTYKKDEATKREKFKCKLGYLINNVYSGSKFVAKAEDNEYFDRAVISFDKEGNKGVDFFYPGQVDPDDPNDEGLDEDDEDEEGELEVVEEDRPSKPKSVNVSLSGASSTTSLVNVGLKTSKEANWLGPGAQQAKTTPRSVTTVLDSESEMEEDFKKPSPKVGSQVIDLASQVDVSEPVPIPPSTTSSADSSSRDGITKNPVALDLGKQEDTNQHKYKKSGYIHTFIPNVGLGFYLVKYKNVKIWETSNNNQLAKRVDFSINDFTNVFDVKLDLYGGNLKKFTSRNDGPWEEGEAIFITPCEVNIKAIRDTEQFLSQSNANMRTIMAKPGFAFNVVKEAGGLGGMGFSSGTTIYQSSERNEFVNKIIRDGAGLRENITEATLFLVNGLEKKFYKNGNVWEEYTTFNQIK